MLCCFVSVFIYTKMTLSTAFGVLDMYLFIDQHLFIDQSALGRWCGLYHTGRLNFSQAFVPVIILLRADVWVQVNLISFSLPLWYGIEPLTSCVCQNASVLATGYRASCQATFLGNRWRTQRKSLPFLCGCWYWCTWSTLSIVGETLRSLK